LLYGSNGLSDREPKEITLKNLSKIIHARVIEILETVFVEIKNYGHDESKKQLIAGVVLTGGGAQLKHIKQLAEYVTGMPSRIGYPNEHLAGDSDTESTSPLFATAVGLVLKGLDAKQFKESKSIQAEATVNQSAVTDPVTSAEKPEAEIEEKPTVTQPNKGKGIFENWANRFKDFLDKAE